MTEKATDIQKTEQQAVTGEARRMERRLEFRPDVDIYERKDAFMIVADMPGVADKDVDIQMEDDVLTIEAATAPELHAGYELLYGEHEAGVYSRSFTISSDINRDGISAQLKNGVLRLTLPKAEQAQPRKISVKAE